jgi:hypothetical protein
MKEEALKRQSLGPLHHFEKKSNLKLFLKVKIVSR